VLFVDGCLLFVIQYLASDGKIYLKKRKLCSTSHQMPITFLKMNCSFEGQNFDTEKPEVLNEENS